MAYDVRFGAGSELDINSTESISWSVLMLLPCESIGRYCSKDEKGSLATQDPER